MTFLCMVFAIAWSPVIIGFDTLWSYLQTTLAYVAPPALALFILGVFWRRATATGAIAGMATGHLAAAVFLVLTVTGTYAINFLYLAPILLLIAMAVMVVVSLNTPAPAPEKVDGLTWSPAYWRAESRQLEGVPFWKNYRVQSVALAAITAVVVVWFW